MIIDESAFSGYVCGGGHDFSAVFRGVDYSWAADRFCRFFVCFDGMRSLELMPESLFGKLNNFALLSILFFITMGSSIASTRAGADLYEALERFG